MADWCCTSDWMSESLIRVAWLCCSRATPRPGQPLARAGSRNLVLLSLFAVWRILRGPDGCGWVKVPSWVLGINAGQRDPGQVLQYC